jgi:uncharacterized protein YndB with AHSA1/START domain
VAANRETVASGPEIHITRVFDAPRELVFRAWTDREHLLRWHAPRGCSLVIRELDFRPGGVFHYAIQIADGRECWCKGVYREIVEPERIVYTLARTDESGGDVDPRAVGMHPEWPAVTVVTLTFEDLGGKTRLTLDQTVSEALARQTGAHPSWLQMLDRLAEDLAAA